jgi:DNA-binding NarL/FixJ family response regulator
LIVDDHPALRAGVTVVLEAEPGLVVVGATTSLEELVPLLRRTRPDVVLLDCHPPKVHGLRLFRRIKHLLPAPRVLIYSAYVDERLRIAASVAGADGVLDKCASARALVNAIRIVDGGRRLLTPIGYEHAQAALDLLDPQDAPILAMLLDHKPALEIAEALDIQPTAVERRMNGILDRLCVNGPTSVP